MAACRSCMFWEPKRAVPMPDKPSVGSCRRSTPTPTWLNGAPKAVWPMTQALDWCGEHKREPEIGDF